MSFRLAEAIRIGSKEVPQCVGFAYYGRDGNIASACALGAAAMTIGALVNYESSHTAAYLTLKDTFPELTAQIGPQSLGSNLGRRQPSIWTLASEIVWLNDKMGWTREQIADWVETL